MIGDPNLFTVWTNRNADWIDTNIDSMHNFIVRLLNDIERIGRGVDRKTQTDRLPQSAMHADSCNFGYQFYLACEWIRWKRQAGTLDLSKKCGSNFHRRLPTPLKRQQQPNQSQSKYNSVSLEPPL